MSNALAQVPAFQERGRRRRTGPRPARITEAIRSQRAAESEAQRLILRELCDKRGYKSLSELARAAKLPPSTLHNFVRGASASLATDSLMRLSSVLPEVIQRMLSTAPGGELPADLARHQARAGAAAIEKPLPTAGRYAIEVSRVAELGFGPLVLPVAQRESIGAPLTNEWAALEPFGVRARGAGADRLYPDNTLLVCLPFTAATRKLIVPGKRLLTARHLAGRPPRNELGKAEMLVRELRGVDRHLVLRSSLPDPVAEPIVLPERVTPTFYINRRESITIVGIVVMACVEE